MARGASRRRDRKGTKLAKKINKFCPPDTIGTQPLFARRPQPLSKAISGPPQTLFAPHPLCRDSHCPTIVSLNVTALGANLANALGRRADNIAAPRAPRNTGPGEGKFIGPRDPARATATARPSKIVVARPGKNCLSEA